MYFVLNDACFKQPHIDLFLLLAAHMDGNVTLQLFPSNHSHINTTCSRNNIFKTLVLPVLYSCLFLVGLSLNSVAVWVFFRIPSRSHFIIYLKNIVVADVVMTLTFPFKVCYIYMQ